MQVLIYTHIHSYTRFKFLVHAICIVKRHEQAAYYFYFLLCTSIAVSTQVLRQIIRETGDIEDVAEQVTLKRKPAEPESPWWEGMQYLCTKFVNINMHSELIQCNVYPK